MKIFKAKKKRKRKINRILLIIFFFFFIFSYYLSYSYVSKKKLNKNILNNDINYIKFNIVDYALSKISEFVNEPSNFLVINKNYNKYNNITNDEVKKVNIEYKNEFKPDIYIYNTHQKEEYYDYDVLQASMLLNNKINNIEKRSIVEENSMKAFLDNNNLKYNKSYQASRNYINEALNKYSTLKYFFDIHRDSVNKDISTLNINNKSYAKVLFVVGSDNVNKENNLKNATYLNNIIESKVPNISRGIVTHGGFGYNGIYNQDLSDNVFLIEIGGISNTKEEVENTINILSEAILEYIRGIL